MGAVEVSDDPGSLSEHIMVGVVSNLLKNQFSSEAKSGSPSALRASLLSPVICFIPFHTSFELFRPNLASILSLWLFLASRSYTFMPLCSQVSLKQSKLHALWTLWLLTTTISSFVWLARDFTFLMMIDGRKVLNFLSFSNLSLVFLPTFFPHQ